MEHDLARTELYCRLAYDYSASSALCLFHRTLLDFAATLRLLVQRLCKVVRGSAAHTWRGEVMRMSPRTRVSIVRSGHQLEEEGRGKDRVSFEFGMIW